MSEPPATEPPKGKRTEWVTREYDDAGELVSETLTVKTEVKPGDDLQPPGLYL